MNSPAEDLSSNSQLASSETEFGVAIPGTILPEEQWVKTALKKMPAPGPIDFDSLFGRVAPVVLDLGCGNGRFTLASAIARPELNHFACDILPVVIRYATRRGNQRGLSNTRWAVVGGRELLRDFIKPQSVQEIHCYHPQPYYEKHEIGRRLINPEFLALVYSALDPTGLFVVQTDNPAYWQYMQEVLPSFFDLQVQEGPWPDAPLGRTRREILALQQGLPVFRGVCKPLAGLGADDLEKLAKKLPRPKFNADRRLMELDRLEAAEAGPGKATAPKNHGPVSKSQARKHWN